MLDNARIASSKSIEISTKTRAYCVAYLSDKFNEFESHATKTLEGSGEMEVDDVSAVEVNQPTGYVVNENRSCFLLHTY